MKKMIQVLPLVALVFSSFFAQAEAPKVGRRAAAKFFENDQNMAVRSPNQDSALSATGGSEVLMLHIGTFIGSKSYAWKGSESRDNIGRSSYGVTYRYDDWHGMDLNIRGDFLEYRIDSETVKKLSLLPIITFPRAESRFPLYFGFGAGLGVFFSQVSEESSLSLDYQLIAGARFMDLFENFGFFFELGMKNHLHLLSDGQFNGTAMTAGGVFSF